MSSNLKPALAAYPDLVRGSFYRLAIVGAATLKGKEVADVLQERNFPSMDVKLLDDEDALGQLEALKDEVTFIQSVRPEQFERIDFTFFAAGPESTRKNWQTARRAGSAIVDLSYGLEDEPGAVVRSPWVERQLGLSFAPELQPAPAVVAHPAAVVLSLVLLRAEKAGTVRRAVATVFEPASEHGQKGMDELHEQTVNLLSFQPLPKAVFDTQVAFNLVSRYGEESAPPLSAVENRVLKHYRLITQDQVRPPALLLMQAPIFHGQLLAMHVELEQATDLTRITECLAGERVKITPPEQAPSSVSAAGQNDILLSILPDSSGKGGFWVWAAWDNLRVAASTAVECAENMAATRPRGKIQ
jgi:aspartate-semialdehyde dehydrogenase